MMAAMGGGAGAGGHGGHGIHRSSMHLTNPESFIFSNENRRRMLNSPLSQSFFYPKTSSASIYPSAPFQSIRRSGNSDVFSYINQAAKNNFKSANNMNGYAYFVDTPLKEAPGQESAPSTGVQANQPRKNDNFNGNLQAAASSPGNHVAFAAPPSSSGPNSPNMNNNPSSVGASPALPNSPLTKHHADSQLNAQQASPVYRPAAAAAADENHNENRSSEKVDHYAIREQAFDPKHLVHSQLSAIQFQTSPELAKLEESLKRSAE